jgi:hypothetical protein
LPTRAGKNGRHALVGLLRQSVFGRLAGYEDVNGPERLRHDPAMRWIVGGKTAQGSAASPSQMGRFETEWLASGGNFHRARRSPGALDRPSPWPSSAEQHRARQDSSVSPTYGDQQGTAYNAHFARTFYHPLFVTGWHGLRRS